MELSLVPFSTAAGRLRQCVRELARELGKDVHFEILDGNVRLDRRVLDALIDPLMHALRNALDHGIESDEERRSVGKPPRGSVRLSVARRGERVRITVNDDGRGMRPDDLRRTAVKLGLLREEEAAALTDSEALMRTTPPRFTTRSLAAHVSGRGVGLERKRLADLPVSTLARTTHDRRSDDEVIRGRDLAHFVAPCLFGFADLPT